MGGHREEKATYIQATREVSGGTSPANTLLEDFQFQNGEIWVCVVKPPSLWDFAMAALANSHTDVTR